MDYYIFAADIYCEDCGRAIQERLTAEGKSPADLDPRTFDSGDFPKGPYDGKSDESDTPEHCACGEHCINAIQIGKSGPKSGAWIENPLTSAGVHYVIEAVREGGDVAEFWRDCYREELQAEKVF